MGRRSDIDWERIERLYVAGQMTIRQISEECGVAHQSITKKARKEGWSRGERSYPVRASVPRKGGSVQLSCSNNRLGGYLYVFYVEANGERMYKIGVAKNPIDRQRAHQISNPLELMIACSYYSPSVYEEEAFLHGKFASQHIRGEWFRLVAEDLKAIAARSLLV